MRGRPLDLRRRERRERREMLRRLLETRVLLRVMSERRSSCDGVVRLAVMKALLDVRRAALKV
jgi:hypothetical protein